MATSEYDVAFAKEAFKLFDAYLVTCNKTQVLKVSNRIEIAGG